MKILTISDTHGLHYKLNSLNWPKADTLIHAGDCTNIGQLNGPAGLKSFLLWFSNLDNYKYKIFIAGNHDKCFEDYYNESKELVEKFPNIIYLQDESIMIDGVKFYGSPRTPQFGYDWAFNCARDEEEQKSSDNPLIRSYWENIDKDTDILITHGPPHGINDFVPYRGGEHVGCKDLLDIIKTQLNLKTHIFGHIHYSNGLIFKDNIKFINASICTERYEPINNPIYIEV